MAEEFQAAGICGGNWWNINPTRGVFPLSSSSPCSMAANDAAGSNYSTWQNDLVDLKVTRSCADDEETNNSLVSDSSLGFLDATKHQQSESASGNGSIFIDSTLQMMGFGLSSSSASSNWNHSLFRCSGRPESNFHSVLQEEKGIDSSNSPTTQKDWRQKSFSSGGGGQVSTINDAFKQMNQELSLDHHQQSLSSVTSTGNSAVTCQGLSSGGFPIGSASYGYPSTLIQSLYDPDIPQPQHSLFTNRSAYSSCTTNYIGTTSNELSPTNWSKASDPFLKPSMPKQQQQPSGLHFSNNTPFWNASAEGLNDIRAGVFTPSQAQYQTSTLINEKPSFPSALLSTKPKTEEAPNSASVVKKSVCEPGLKRQRIETPSQLPTFKVRKEKLGDRITALQQLVSPFGKTDTASVLHEAIEYIKFLHDQVSVLSTPYMKNGAPIQQQQLKGCDLKDSEGPKQDLRSRGLCLVPISSTFPVTNETTADFWTPAFGGALIR